MSATGLDVFEKTLQTTHIWLGEIMEQHGPDRKVAWHILSVVLRVLRDRLPPEIAAQRYATPCPKKFSRCGPTASAPANSQNGGE